MASFEPTGEQVFYILFFGPLVLVGLCVLWAVWVIGGGMTTASLVHQPQLVGASSKVRTLWRVAAWVPVVGPVAYGLALLTRRIRLGEERWRAIQACTSRREGFVPRSAQRRAAVSQPDGGVFAPPRR